MMGGQPPPHHFADDADRFVDFLQQQFASPEFSDVSLELKYLDDRAVPVRVPGHRVIFARSPALLHLFRIQKPDQSAWDGSNVVLSLETDSKWIRSDSFYMATQRLYGLPLLPVPHPHGLPNGGDLADAGSMSERFDFALSYAAAGHMLAWEPLVCRGCEIAAQLINWQTMDRALQFALEDFVDKGAYESYKYEIGSKILLHGVVNFIINNLPPTFVLEGAASEQSPYSRLPAHPTPERGSAATGTGPAVVRSPQAGRGKGHRQQLSTIQFGDLSLAEGPNGSASETPKASQRAQPMAYNILSRALLNLPFGFLKMILESAGSGNADGWVRTEPRHRIISDVVAHREALRAQAVEAVATGLVADASHAYQQLRVPEPRDLDKWGVLGWQEEVMSYGNADRPSLVRRWVPVRSAQGAAVAEFP